MGIIAKNNRQLTLIYSSNTSIGAKVHAYAQAAEDKLQAIDIAKTKVSDSMWAEIATKLGVSIGALVSHPGFDTVTNTYNQDDWLKILQHDDRTLAKPIAINGDRMEQLESATSILDFLGIDSAALENRSYTEPPGKSPRND
jgi:arsenate reductase-like glutaredoxin family protein